MAKIEIDVKIFVNKPDVVVNVLPVVVLGVETVVELTLEGIPNVVVEPISEIFGIRPIDTNKDL